MIDHFLSAADLSREEAEALLGRARALKAEWRDGGHRSLPLQGKTLALVFEKPSLRTRVAFEAGMTQLGGHGSYLSANDIDMGGRESVPDVARNLSRWVQVIAARVFRHATVAELARHSRVPVINALCDREHPCQALADLLTIKEKKGQLSGLKLAFVGDGNNVCHSLMFGCAKVGIDVAVVTPKGYEPKEEIISLAKQDALKHGVSINITNDPVEAVKDADVVVTDVWASMGQEAEQAQRAQDFAPYQVNDKLVSHARPDYIFLHCLPAHRGEEVVEDIIDGPNSVVWDEAENRLHTQKALLAMLL